MDISVNPTSARCDDDTLWVNLSDGRTIGVPLVWYPRLLDATAEQRATVTLSPAGLHWDEIDEDISVAGLIAGRRDMTHPSSRAA